MDQIDDRSWVSDKSYGTSVAICAVFGVIGIHHFYVERWLMGFLDFGLFVLTITLFVMGYTGLGILVALIDATHTVFVTYKLLVGEYKDGQGRIIAYPDQKRPKNM